MALRWSDGITLKFVGYYKESRCLWDTSLEDYTNQQLRVKAYKSIAEKMEIPNLKISDIKCKIRNLRSTYHQEMKKVTRQAGREGSGMYIPKLVWFREFEEIMSSERKGSSQEIIASKYEYLNETGLNVNFPPPETIMEHEPSISNVEPIKHKRQKVQSMQKAVELLEGIKAQNVPVHDEFHHFGNNVAAQLRQLPLERALRVQIKMQELLAAERLYN